MVEQIAILSKKVFIKIKSFAKKGYFETSKIFKRANIIITNQST